MRLSQVFELFEAIDPQEIITVGDSHAKAIGRAGGFQNIAVDGANVQQIAQQAAGVPDGRVVLLSAGNNNVGAQHNAVAGSVRRIIRDLKARNCKVFFVLFPMIDLNGPYKETYEQAGYTNNYNTVRETLRRQVSGDVEAAYELNTADISPSDPMKIHAKPSAYQRIANAVKPAAETAIAQANRRGVDTSGEGVNDENTGVVFDRELTAQETQLLDRNGDGVVGVNDLVELGVPENDIVFANGFTGDGIGGIFAMLLNADDMRKKKVSTNSKAFRQALQNAQDPDYGVVDGGNIDSNAQVSGANQREASLIAEARAKWSRLPNTELWIAALVAQCRAETDDFRLSTEQGAASYFDRYEGNTGLGNTQQGDGRRFRGRGWIQLTGRYNYTRASRALFGDERLVENPELAAREDVANKTAIWYFEDRVMPNCDDPMDVAKVSRLVNGGTNGLSRRRQEFAELIDDLRSDQGSGTGQLVLGPNVLQRLDGNQSRLTSRDAGENIQATLQRARRMADIFGGQVTVNDAIAKAGTSRERNTQGSQHFQGTALDLSTSGMSDAQKLRLVNAAQRAGFTGFGFGQNILHVDTGPRRHWAYGNSRFAGVSVASLGTAVRNNRLVQVPGATRTV